jgi:hypothetical protein
MNKFFLLLVITGLILLFQTTTTAQPLPPNGGHGQTGNQIPGGGAPIASGVPVMIALAVVWVGKKTFDLRNLGE